MARLIRAARPVAAALTERLRPGELAIYLDDHRAGAAAGLALARRIERRYGHEPGFAELALLRRQIEEDVRALDRLRDHLDIRGGGVKRILAVVGERITRLKPNGGLGRHSPLSKVVDLEELSSGVAGKRGLWDGLISACGSEQLAGIDLRRLSDRADDQIGSLRVMHQRAAASLECPSDGAGKT